MPSQSQATKPRLSLIVAMAKNRVIGANNALPWQLSSDLRRFKALTMGHHILMGRKTFESIGRILPGRTSVVISRNPGYQAHGAIIARDIASALAQSAGDTDAFVIGGEKIFEEVLPFADRIFLTEIDAEFPGDTFFPPLEPTDWREASRERGTDEASGLRYSYVTLDRVR
ncbi:MAG: dihydrofolate reductase [Betaproteobacteria bacterium]